MSGYCDGYGNTLCICRDIEEDRKRVELAMRDLGDLRMSFEPKYRDKQALSIEAYNSLVKENESLKRELAQQRFNNEKNLSIDQKVADEITGLRKENDELRKLIKEMSDYLGKDSDKNMICTSSLFHHEMRSVLKENKA